MNKFMEMNSNKKDNVEKKEYKTLVDYAIKSRIIRCIYPDGVSKVVNRDDAIAYAQSQGLNVVEIFFSKRNDPPSTCKILNYNKWNYEQKQKAKALKKAARENQTITKEITFKLVSEDYDLNRKIEKAKEFLNDGDTVKFILQLKGRESDLKDMIKDKLDSVIKSFNGIGRLDGAYKLTGRDIPFFIKPIKVGNNGTKK